MTLGILFTGQLSHLYIVFGFNVLYQGLKWYQLPTLSFKALQEPHTL